MNNRRPLIAGNWKLNGTRESVVSLASAIRNASLAESTDVLVCPACVHLADVQSILVDASISLGAQNCAAHESGAFTGEVSPQMLLEFGCEYVIVGHSERRALFGERNTDVALRCAAAQSAGLTPILCVGETLEERESDQVEAVVGGQIDALLAISGVAAFANLVVAYEPVWAIGTGKSASPDQAQAVHALVRQKISQLDSVIAASLRILYGGSVEPDNAATLFAQSDIDGALVGGAALDADSFIAICDAAAV